MKVLLTTIVFISITFASSGQKLIEKWSTDQIFKTPESVLYDEEKDVIYVSNMDNTPSENEDNGFISILGTDGKVINMHWVTGLNAPKGMAIFEGNLYVSDVNKLYIINIESGKIINSYEDKDAVFLNDVTACLNGMIFVSDSNTGKIHVLKNGEFKVWLKSDLFKRPNGLKAENGKLLIGEKSIFQVDIKTKEISTLVEKGGGIDGLERTEKGNFIFSNWAGRIFIEVDGQVIKLHDSTEEKINTADIDYAMKHKLLLVPTFYDNRVVAYKVEH